MSSPAFETTTRRRTAVQRAAAPLALLTSLALLLTLLALPARARTTIELWTTEVESDRMAVIRYLADAFMALNDDVQVQVVPVAEDEMPSTLRSRAENGSMPALIYTDGEQLISFASEGWLDTAPAETIVAELGRDKFFQGPLAALTCPETGKMYAVPYHGWVQGIWYRADWFKAAGLAPPNTLERILAAAKRLHDPAHGRYGILIGTKRDSYTEQVFTHLALAQGIREFDEKGHLVFNSPATVRLLKAYKELAGYGPEGPHNWRARDFYLQGRLAMMFYSTFIMDDLALSTVAADSLTRRNFEILPGAFFDPDLLSKTRMVPVIRGTEPAGYGVFVGWGFGRKLPPGQREAAMRLMRFLFRTDAYVTWMHMAPGGMLPVLRRVAASNLFFRDVQEVFRRYGQDKIGEIVAGLERVETFSVSKGRLNPMAAEISTAGIIPQMVHKALFMDVPAEEAVSWAAREMAKVVVRRGGHE